MATHPQPFRLIGDRPAPLKITDDFKVITIRWPADSKIPTINGKWHRLADGRIEATYTRDELKICLTYGSLLFGPGIPPDDAKHLNPEKAPLSPFTKS